MRRADTIQLILSAIGAPDYLEIGVFEGETFSRVNAKRKIAVDPNFRYDFSLTRRPNEEFYPMTSDEFFRSNDVSIDGVLYVDGLHTYEQSLRDIENCLRVMTKRSVVLVDDCSPGLESEAAPLLPGEVPSGRSWCGDVWKSIVHLRATRGDLVIRSVLDHPGLSCITFGEPEEVLDIDLDWLKQADYKDLFFSREELLNGRR